MPVIQCDHGIKKNAKGNTYHWIGYLASADGDIPLATYLSSASLHDRQPAIILQQTVAARVPAVLYDLADSAYDAGPITFM